ncbi:hypothetical protein ACJ72_00859 [Emergomyces africanus]|uniref:Uncharacterized protein n=1 Tax=Emergomyces africanus TaxID=1955775 RepID=A0A1B7P713_9EURO|nr:hypothetical protein ACJ72_00859 [Emergomyces africanus]
MATSNDQSGTGEASDCKGQGRPRGEAWTEEEEMWLVVTSMGPDSYKWLAQNIPAANGRTWISISSRLSQYRINGKIPQRWRSPDIKRTPDWEIKEDLEIIEWILHGKTKIDARVFVEANRSGEEIKRRSRFLMSHEEFAAIVYDTEESLRLELLRHDMAVAGPEKQAAYAALLHAEDNGERIILEALQRTRDGSVYEPSDWQEPTTY